MTKYWWIGLVVSIVAILFACWCFYAFAFFAWVTATPVTDEVRAQSGQRAELWLMGFVTSLLVGVGMMVWIVVVARRS